MQCRAARAAMLGHTVLTGADGVCVHPEPHMNALLYLFRPDEHLGLADGPTPSQQLMSGSSQA